jgi:hypothetical protein
MNVLVACCYFSSFFFILFLDLIFYVMVDCLCFPLTLSRVGLLVLMCVNV